MPSAERVTLTDEFCRRLKSGTPRMYRDEVTKGLFLQIGKRRMTWRYESEQRGTAVSRRLGHLPAVSLTAARKAAAVAEGERASDAPAALGPRQGQTFAAAFAAYIKELEQTRDKENPHRPCRWARQIKRMYEQHMADTWGSTTLAAMSKDPDSVKAWYDEMTETVGQVTADHMIRAIRAMYRKALKGNAGRRLPKELPTSAVECATYKPVTRGMLPDAVDTWREWRKQVDSITSVPPTKTKAKAADRRRSIFTRRTLQAFHMLNLFLGTRPGELARVKLADVKPGQLTLRDTKNGADVSLPTTPAIESWLKVAADTAQKIDPATVWLFPSTKKRTHIKRWNREGLRFMGHALRHSYSNVADDVGAGTQHKRKLMGHSLPTMDAIYTASEMRAQSEATKATQAKISARIVELLTS